VESLLTFAVGTMTALSLEAICRAQQYNQTDLVASASAIASIAESQPLNVGLLLAVAEQETRFVSPQREMTGG
jgi:hypothetical protein